MSTLGFRWCPGSCASLSVKTVGCVILASIAFEARAQPSCPGAGTVFAQHRITQHMGGLTTALESGDLFGISITVIGDVDDDGNLDLAVGAPRDDDGGQDRGAVHILFMDANGTVKASQTISSVAGGLPGVLDNGDNFGMGVASLGDFDGDGVPDLVTTAMYDDDGGSNRGAAWLLMLNANGTVKQAAKISAISGNFGGFLDNGDSLGFSVAVLGDRDGNGVTDIALGAIGDDDGGQDRGALWIVYLNANGTVKSQQKISNTSGNFSGNLDNSDWFGTSVAVIGDVDGDTIADLAVGAQLDDDGGQDCGAIWVLFMNANGTVKAHQKISALSGDFGSGLDNADTFGGSITRLGDLDNDGTTEILVGAENDDDGGADRGAAWVLFLKPDARVKSKQKISQTTGGFSDMLLLGGTFGRAGAVLGDLDNDGRVEVAIGAHSVVGAATNPGEIWIASFNDCAHAPTLTLQPESIVVNGPVGQAVFTVAATGAPTPAYQWRRDGLALIDGGNIQGAKTPQLSVAASRDDIGLYDCVVSNANGQAVSAGAVLAVRDVCYPDCDANGQLDIEDFICFQTLFAVGC